VTHVLGNEVLFDCDLSAQTAARSALRKKIDVTDPHLRAGRRFTWSRRSRKPFAEDRTIENRSRRRAPAQPASIAIWILAVAGAKTANRSGL